MLTVSVQMNDFSKFIELCNHHYNTVLEYSYHPAPNPRQLLNCFLSLNGILLYVIFPVWLLLLSIMLLRLNYIAACFMFLFCC